MKDREFTMLLVAEAMQRHKQIVDAAQHRLNVAVSEHDSAKTALDRAKDNQAAFLSFVKENQP